MRGTVVRRNFWLGVARIVSASSIAPIVTGITPSVSRIVTSVTSIASSVIWAATCTITGVVTRSVLGRCWECSKERAILLVHLILVNNFGIAFVQGPCEVVLRVVLEDEVVDIVRIHISFNLKADEKGSH